MNGYTYFVKTKSCPPHAFWSMLLVLHLDMCIERNDYLHCKMLAVHCKRLFFRWWPCLLFSKRQQVCLLCIFWGEYLIDNMSITAETIMLTIRMICWSSCRAIFIILACIRIVYKILSSFYCRCPQNEQAHCQNGPLHYVNKLQEKRDWLPTCRKKAKKRIEISFSLM